MKNLQRIALLFLLIFSLGISTQAQLSKVGKNVKVSGRNTTKKVVGKCDKLKDQLDKNVSEAERFLKLDNLRNAESNVIRLEDNIKKSKDAHCPMFKDYETKYSELAKKLNEALIVKYPTKYLRKAVAENDKELLLKAIQSGADLNVQYTKEGTKESTSPITAAVKNKNYDIVELLADNGADIDKAVLALSALYEAVNLGDEKMCKLLISKGAKNNDGKNAIYLAADKDNLAIYKLLIDTFNDGNPIFEEKDYNRRPYETKKYTNTLEIVKAKANSEIAKYIVDSETEKLSAAISDPVHKKYINKVVFSNEEIPASNANENKFITKINASKDIFTRLYLPVQLNKLRIKEGVSDYKVSVYKVHIKLENEDKKIFIGEGYCDEYKEDVSLPLTINTYKGQKSYYRKFYSKLKNGENKATVTFTFRDDVVFTTNVTFVKKPNEMYLTGRHFSDYKSNNNDPKLNAKVLAGLKKLKPGIQDVGTYTKVKIQSKDWKIKRHNVSGEILARTLMVHAYKVTNEGYCVVQDFTLKQNYDGTKYSDVFLVEYASGGVVVDCD